jgi:3-hydroxyacyl-CoA dehydrogenase
LAGYSVHVHDLSDEVLAAFRHRIEHGRFGVRRGVELGKVTPDLGDATLKRIRTTTNLADALDGVDLVIEAVWEDFGLKVETFGKLDRLAPHHAVLASNTSGFSIAALAGATARPEKVVGWHWSSPASIMRMAEVITHPKTNAETVATVVDVAKRAGKNPQVVKDNPLRWGFVVNRILFAAIDQARQIVAEGVATEDQVDILLKDCFRWPSGLFELLQNTPRNWDAEDRRVRPVGGAHSVTVDRSTNET